MSNCAALPVESGARAVVVSPHKLEYRATLELMNVFHRRLSRGDAPAEALRRARLELAEAPARSPPLDSLVHVLGLGHRPIFPEEHR